MGTGVGYCVGSEVGSIAMLLIAGEGIGVGAPSTGSSPPAMKMVGSEVGEVSPIIVGTVPSAIKMVGSLVGPVPPDPDELLSTVGSERLKIVGSFVGLLCASSIPEPVKIVGSEVG